MPEAPHFKEPHHIEFGPPLEQPHFYKSISEFEPGDRVWVSDNDMRTKFEDKRKTATVLGIKPVGTFTKQATVLLDGAPDVSTTKTLDLHHKFELASLEGQDVVWVSLQYIRPGHIIQWWGHEVAVEAVEHKGNAYVLTVTDPVDQKQKRFQYKSTDALHMKIAEPSEEKRAWRERRLASHLLPPIEIRPGETPEELAKRVMRQMEEWTED